MNNSDFIARQVALQEATFNVKMAIAEQNAKYNSTLREKANKMTDRELLEAIYVKLYTI